MDTAKTERPLILVTNDDSIDAPGLHVLVRMAVEHGDVVCVAPRFPQSGKSSSMTFTAPLRLREAHPADAVEGVRYYTVDGTPVDCVKLGLFAALERRPDYVLAGVNHGSNSGVNVLYSGTMGAVLEGCVEGIPSAGFSLLHHSPDADFSLSEPLMRGILARFIANPPQTGVCLNINIPAKIVPKGVRGCRSCRGRWTDGYERYTDPMGRTFYMLAGRFVNEEPEATDTDEYWLDRGYAAVVPVTPEMTAAGALGYAAAYDACC